MCVSRAFKIYIKDTYMCGCQYEMKVDFSFSNNIKNDYKLILHALNILSIL